MANILGNLTWTVTDAVTAQASGMLINAIEGVLADHQKYKHGLRFYYQYEAGGSIINVLARSAFGAAAQSLSSVAIEQYKKFLGNKKQEEIRERASNAARTNIISLHHVNDEKRYGRMTVNNSKSSGNASGVNTQGNTVLALDDYGNVCIDALMLGIPLKTPITVYQNVFNPDPSSPSGWQTSSFQSDTLVWYDTAALVSIDSDKNIILTRVQGRDYSRKELVSNGDINFSVSGTICSNMPDVYPEEEVKKFIQVMQYKGVVEVNNQMLDQFGIRKVLIKNFNLTPREGYKSSQQYSFTAVGIQPDKEVMVNEDAITIINQELVNTTTNDEDSWSKLLKDKVEGLKNSSVNIASQGLALATGILDNQLSNL